MYLKYLSLNNFRNYQKQELSLEKGTNIFIGNNAQGKTNILEAIYFLALTKSHRTSKDRELIKLGNSFSIVKGKVLKRGIESEQEIMLSDKGKNNKINNKKISKTSEYIGNINVVMFSPEDLNIIKGGPIYRRRFLDMEIGQINKVYLFHLSKYQRVLKQRNNFLKEIKGNIRGKEDILDVWNSQLIEHGVKIISKRMKYLKLIEQWLPIIQQEISKEEEKITVEYKTTINGNDLLNNKEEITFECNEKILKDMYASELRRMQKNEIINGSTMIGPHRDELIIKINNKNVMNYGSQGQQRTVVLCLKLAEMELINYYKGEYPILLLDDVLSELDQWRQTYLLSKIQNNIQTLLTTTQLNDIKKENMKNAQIYYVENGKIIRN